MSRQVDWDTIEREYRIGRLSIREIARQQGISDAAIRRRAAAAGWARGALATVQDDARAFLFCDLGPEDGSHYGLQDGSQSGADDARARDRRAIETAAARQVEVVRQHRRAIARGRDLTVRLLAELTATTCHAGELEMLITAGDEADRGRALKRAISLPGRSGVMRDLSQAAKNWIALERQAFGIDDPLRQPAGRDGEPPAVSREDAEMLARIDKMGPIEMARRIGHALEIGRRALEARRAAAAEREPPKAGAGPASGPAPSRA